MALSWPSVQLFILSSEPSLKPNDPLDLWQIQMRLVKIKVLKINIAFKCRFESNSYQVLSLIFLKDSGGIVGTLSGVTIRFYLLSVERKCLLQNSGSSIGISLQEQVKIKRLWEKAYVSSSLQKTYSPTVKGTDFWVHLPLTMEFTTCSPTPASWAAPVLYPPDPLLPRNKVAAHK